jgi:phage shock protein C
MNHTRKRLYKSDNKRLWGVLGGFADYFNVDATLIRLGFILLLIFTGIFPGVFIYILFAIFMPPSPHLSK